MIRANTAEGQLGFPDPSAEMFHQAAIVMSDRGIPHGFRHMHFFGERTYSLLQRQKRTCLGQVPFRYQEQGTRSLTDRDAVVQVGATLPGVWFDDKPCALRCGAGAESCSDPRYL